MSELPEGWAACSVADLITELKNGFVAQQSKDGIGVAVTRIETISKGVIDPIRVGYVVPDGKAIDSYRLQDGDILFSHINSPAHLGKTAVYKGTPEVLYHGMNLLLIRASNQVDHRFLEYQFRFLRTEGVFELNAQHAVNQASINQKKLSAIPMLLAPLNEQKRIADKLDALLARVDACRERLNRIPTISKRFRQAVLAAATSGELTEEWRSNRSGGTSLTSTTLDGLVTEVNYGSSAKSNPVGDVPVLRMGNIQDGRLDWKDLVYTSDPAEIKKYNLLPGDVLFNRTNSPELVGKTAVYKGEREAIFAGYLIRVRCRENLLPDYLNYCLNSPAGRDFCWRVKTDGVSQSNINAKKLTDFEFLLPAPEEQREIVRRVEKLFAFADRLEARYKATRVAVDRVTPALLAKAFRGELVPQDSTDEPGSMLLENIRMLHGVDKPKLTRTSNEINTMRVQNEGSTMLNKSEVKPTHLADLLRVRGRTTPEVLWSASQLTIDDFYDQLKQEEAKKLINEVTSTGSSSQRFLECKP